MTINKTQDGNNVILKVSGRLDTVTAPDLDKMIQSITDADSLVIDCSDLEYISSAGLRVLLSTHKTFSAKGGLVVKNVNEIVRDVFEVTGFNDILNVQ